MTNPHNKKLKAMGAKRRALIIRMLKTKTQSQVAAILGISRQRVSEMVKIGEKE
jgi:DNA-binding transcriptional regulator LsrR (DeoR family)